MAGSSDYLTVIVPAIPRSAWRNCEQPTLYTPAFGVSVMYRDCPTKKPSFPFFANPLAHHYVHGGRAKKFTGAENMVPHPLLVNTSVTGILAASWMSAGAKLKLARMMSTRGGDSVAEAEVMVIGRNAHNKRL